jgi:hypothetical protein
MNNPQPKFKIFDKVSVMVYYSSEETGKELEVREIAEVRSIIATHNRQEKVSFVYQVIFDDNESLRSTYEEEDLAEVKQ